MEFLVALQHKNQKPHIYVERAKNKASVLPRLPQLIADIGDNPTNPSPALQVTIKRFTKKSADEMWAWLKSFEPPSPSERLAESLESILAEEHEHLISLFKGDI